MPPPTVRYTPSEDDVYATIRLGPRARWVAEYYPVDVLEEEGEELVVRFAASDVAVVARLLVRLGTDAVLVDGDEVDRATATLRGRILTRYGVSRTS